jgi:hypothetical protein
MTWRVVGWALALSLLWGDHLALAQIPALPADAVGLWVLPSLKTSGVHEQNVVFAQDAPTGESLVRVTPSFDVRHRGSRGSWDAGYSFDSERYSGQVGQSLTGVFTRQIGVMAFESNLTPRSRLSGRARHLVTRRPEELRTSDVTGLVPVRRQSTSFEGEGGLARNLSERVRGQVNYSLNVEDYGSPTDERPSVRSMLHSVATELSVQRTPLTSWGIEYRGELLTGEDLTTRSITRGVFGSNTLAIRWTRSLTPRVALVAIAGPRMSQALADAVIRLPETPVRWELRPELLTSVAYRGDQLVTSIAYARSAFMGYGASGFVDTQSLESRVTFAVGARRQLLVLGRTGVYRNALADRTAMSYRADAVTSYQLLPWLGVDVTYLHKQQDRALSLAETAAGARQRRRIRNSIMFGLTLHEPIHLD